MTDLDILEAFEELGRDYGSGSGKCMRLTVDWDQYQRQRQRKVSGVSGSDITVAVVEASEILALVDRLREGL